MTNYFLSLERCTSIRKNTIEIVSSPAFEPVRSSSQKEQVSEYPSPAFVVLQMSTNHHVEDLLLFGTRKKRSSGKWPPWYSSLVERRASKSVEVGLFAVVTKDAASSVERDSDDTFSELVSTTRPKHTA